MKETKFSKEMSKRQKKAKNLSRSRRQNRMAKRAFD